MQLRFLFLSTVWSTVMLLASYPSSYSAADTNEKAATPVLQGGVVEINTALNDLRDARLAVSRVRKAAANLYDEVTRQQVTMNYNPNMVGTTIIMTPSPSFSGAYLPPRKKWVLESMSEMEPTLKLFKEDVDYAIENDRRVDVSENGHKSLDPLRQEAFDLVTSSFDLYKSLEPLTAGPNYDNDRIAAISKKLNENLKTLDKTLKKGISVLQNEAKASKKKHA